MAKSPGSKPTAPAAGSSGESDRPLERPKFSELLAQEREARAERVGARLEAEPDQIVDDGREIEPVDTAKKKPAARATKPVERGSAETTGTPAARTAAAQPAEPTYKDIDEFYRADPEGAKKYAKNFFDEQAQKPLRQDLLKRMSAAEAAYIDVAEKLKPIQPLLNRLYQSAKKGDAGSKALLEKYAMLNNETFEHWTFGTALETYNEHFHGTGAPEAGERGSAAVAAAHGGDPELVSRLSQLEQENENRRNAEAISKRDQMVEAEMRAYEQERNNQFQELARDHNELWIWGKDGKPTNQRAIDLADVLVTYVESKSRDKDGNLLPPEQRMTLSEGYAKLVADRKRRQGAEPPPVIARTTPGNEIEPVDDSRTESRRGDEARGARIRRLTPQEIQASSERRRTQMAQDLKKVGGFATYARRVAGADSE